MVQAMININENVNRVLNIIKAKYGLKDKSEALNLLVYDYEENSSEPELRPQYKEKLLKIDKGKFKRFSSYSLTTRFIASLLSFKPYLAFIIFRTLFTFSFI